MKKTLSILLSILSLSIMAQVPQGVGYQGVATDANGIELVNQAISIRASVLSGSATGTIEWEETHATTTDTFGLFTLTIGQGTNTTNGLQTSFADISWGTNTHFLKIEMDVTGGTNYSFMGTNQMMSVPYALYAESANINYDSISNILSNDSTFITNIGGGMGGDGCSFNYPDGLSGDIITININPNNNSYPNYIVPNGKTLYINTLHKTGAYNSVNFQSNGISLHAAASNDGNGRSINTPYVFDEGTILEGSVNFNGILISNSNIIPITHLLNNGSGQTTDYVVTSGKSLYITQVKGSLSINNLTVMALHNYDGALGKIIIAASGDVIKGSNYTSFNGYLADENYFAGCGGGGSSSTSSLDSTTIANMIAAAGGGGCDFQFPNGTHGDYLSFNPLTDPLTVPAGKRFYVLQSGGPTHSYFIVDGLTIPNNFPNGTVIIDENQVISSQVGYSEYINGILINANNNIEPFASDLYSNPFVVPLGKILVVQSTGISGDLIVNGNTTSLNSLNNPQPFVLAESVTVETYSQPGVITGYLVDKNYFAGCGGGGSSSATSSLDSTTIANMIARAISNSVSIGIGDYYGGGIVGYIFQPGDADYILGETHGYILYFDNTGIQWGCNGVTTNVVNNNLGQGPNNTQTLLNLCPESNFAAKWCNDLVIGPYNDWFLPNYEEAILMDLSFYLNITNSSSNLQIWLSEEFSISNPYNYNCPSCSSANTAWVLYNTSGTLSINSRNKNSTQSGNVIAFRKF